MNIGAQTKLFCLLGNPVGHSMSPFMHSLFLEQTGVDGAYLAFAVETDKVGDALKGLHALGVKGCNVTIPHKETVIPYLVGMSDAAKACGAVNTLIYTEEGYYGDNTDGAGMLAALEAKQGWTPEGKKVIIAGAGGAAKGIAVAMALRGADTICIANRKVEKAQHLAEQIAGISSTKTAFVALSELENPAVYGEYHTLVNTTSLGMSPKVDDMIPLCAEALTPEHLVVDAVYNPLETRLLRTAKEAGAKTASGLGMFLYQGALAFEAWTGIRPEMELPEQKVTEELLKR